MSIFTNAGFSFLVFLILVLVVKVIALVHGKYRKQQCREESIEAQTASKRNSQKEKSLSNHLLPLVMPNQELNSVTLKGAEPSRTSLAGKNVHFQSDVSVISIPSEDAAISMPVTLAPSEISKPMPVATV